MCQLKKEAIDTKAAQDTTKKMKVEADKLVKEVVAVRVELADLKVSSEVVTGVQDCLCEQAIVPRKEKEDTKMVMVELETDQECKDDYIYHLAFQLNPHLYLLLAEVTYEICRMSEEIRVFVTLTNHQAPRQPRLVVVIPLLLFLMLDLTTCCYLLYL